MSKSGIPIWSSIHGDASRCACMHGTCPVHCCRWCCCASRCSEAIPTNNRPQGDLRDGAASRVLSAQRHHPMDEFEAWAVIRPSNSMHCHLMLGQLSVRRRSLHRWNSCSGTYGLEPRLSCDAAHAHVAGSSCVYKITLGGIWSEDIVAAYTNSERHVLSQSDLWLALRALCCHPRARANNRYHDDDLGLVRLLVTHPKHMSSPIT